MHTNEQSDDSWPSNREAHLPAMRPAVVSSVVFQSSLSPLSRCCPLAQRTRLRRHYSYDWWSVNRSETSPDKAFFQSWTSFNQAYSKSRKQQAVTIESRASPRLRLRRPIFRRVHGWLSAADDDDFFVNLAGHIRHKRKVTSLGVSANQPAACLASDHGRMPEWQVVLSPTTSPTQALDPHSTAQVTKCTVHGVSDSDKVAPGSAAAPRIQICGFHGNQ